MITRKSTFFLGIFIFLIPFLGIPSSSKTFFVAVSGLYLIFLSVKISLPHVTKKSVKAPRPKREKVIPVIEVVPIVPKENTDSKHKSIDGIQIK